MTTSQIDNGHPYDLIAGVPIDKEIGPLIAALWIQGYQTTSCCQGGCAEWPDAYIAFDTAENAWKFAMHTASKAHRVKLNVHLNPTPRHIYTSVKFSPESIPAITEAWLDEKLAEKISALTEN